MDLWKVRDFTDFTGKFEVFDGGGWRVDFIDGGAGTVDFLRNLGIKLVRAMKR